MKKVIADAIVFVVVCAGGAYLILKYITFKHGG